MAKQRKKPAAPAPKVAAVGVDQWSVARTISWWSLLALVFVTPIAMSNLSFLGFELPLTYDQFDIAKLFFQRVLGLIAIGAWVWDMGLNGGKLRRTPVDWLILAFLAWVTVSAALSIHPPTAILGKYRRFEGLLSFVNYALIYFLVLQLADRPSRIKTLAQTLFWSGAVVALYGVMQSLGRDVAHWGKLPFEPNRAFSTYGNPDLLGGFLMFSVFVSLALALAEENLKWRAVYWLGFLLNMWCVVVAFTRSAWVGSVVGFAFIVAFALRHKVSWKAIDWGFSGAVGALVAAVITRSLSNPNEVMNFGKRLASILQFSEGSSKTRFEIWEAAIAAIKDRPIFGFGADTFRLIFPKYKPFEYSADAGYLSVADNVHNYPLQLATGIGVPGVVMLYAIVAWAAIRSWPVVFAKEGGAKRMIVAGFWAASAAYVTHLFFGLSVTGTSFLLWAAMGVVLGPTASTVEIKRPSWGVAAAVAVTVIALLGIGWQVRFTMADHAYMLSRVGATGAERTAATLKAVRLNPYNDIYRAEVGLAYYDEVTDALGRLNQGDQQAGAQVSGSFAKAEAAFRDTITFVPWEYDNYVFLANLYNLGSQVFGEKYDALAIETAQRGVKVEPYGAAIRVQLARALDTTGDAEGAIEQLRYALRLDPRFTEAAILLSIVYENEGRAEAALKVLKDSQAVAPGNPEVDSRIEQLEASAAATP